MDKHALRCMALPVAVALVACGNDVVTPKQRGQLPAKVAAKRVQLPFEGRVRDGVMTVVIPSPSDFATGSGEVDTVELRNSGAPPGVVTDGCAPGVDSYEGNVVIQSFYDTETLNNVAVIIDTVNPMAAAPCNLDVIPSGTGFAFTPTALGAGATTNAKLWKFQKPASGNFNFSGHVEADIVAPSKRVFIDSLANVPDGSVGLAGLDAACTAAAGALGGTWIALASTTTQPISSRLQNALPYLDLTGGFIAADGNTLLTAGAAIVIDQDGNDLTGLPVELTTGTLGGVAGPNCIDWTSAAAVDTTITGALGSGSPAQISGGLGATCDNLSATFLICVEQ